MKDEKRYAYHMSGPVCRELSDWSDLSDVSDSRGIPEFRDTASALPEENRKFSLQLYNSLKGIRP